MKALLVLVSFLGLHLSAFAQSEGYSLAASAGSGATIPSVTTLIKGDGGGNGASSGLTGTANSIGFSIAGGTTSKTLTLSNTVTIAGTDGSTLNIGAGGTLGSAAFTASTAYDAAGAAAAVRAVPANLTLTNPASAATFTLVGGKTLTVNNTLTLSGTDGASVTIGDWFNQSVKTTANPTFNTVSGTSTSYDQQALFRIVASDPDFAYGSYSDGGSNYWMQVHYYGDGTANRGFRVVDGNGSVVVLSANHLAAKFIKDVYTNNASFLIRTSTSLTGGGTGSAPTLTAGPIAGNPTKWLPVDDNGTTRYVPSW